MKRISAIFSLLVLGIGLVALVASCAPAATPTPAPTSPPAATKAPAPAATSAPAPTTPPTAAPKAAAPTPRPLIKAKAGMNMSTSNTPFWIGIERGYYKEIGLDIELVTVQTGPDTIPPLSTGEMLIAAGAIGAAHFNAVLRDIPIKMVLASNTSQQGQSDSTGFLVRKDLIDSGKVKEIKDLKGLTIGIASLASASEIATDLMLAQGGLKPGDVNKVTMAMPDMVAALANKSIDVSMNVEPALTQAEDLGVAVLKWKVSDVASPFQWGANNLSPVLWQKNPDLARDFAVAHLRAIRDYADAMGPKKKDRAAVLNYMVKYSSEKNVAVLEKLRPAGVNPDGLNYVDSIGRQLDWYTTQGVVKQPMKVTDIVDNSYAEYALSKLGKYQP